MLAPLSDREGLTGSARDPGVALALQFPLCGYDVGPPRPGDLAAEFTGLRVADAIG